MKAAFIERHGPAESIRYGDLPVPELHERSVLVRVSAVTVDHVDTFIRSGAFPATTSFPFVIDLVYGFRGGRAVLPSRSPLAPR
jgi:NADPH:quinone reductase-like Zn-dependent oxidoreductase